MKLLANMLVALAFASSDGSESVTAEIAPSLCPKTLKPTETVPPRFGGTRELTFEGSAVVEAWVMPTGETANVAIVTSEWESMIGGDVEFVDKQIVVAVRKWKYPHHPETCLVRIPLKIEVLH